MTNKKRNPAILRSVRIERAKNGFIVSAYSVGEEKQFISKTQKEALKQADKLLKK